MYLIWRRLQFLFQIQDDFGRKDAILGGEIIHAFILACGGDHRANANAVEVFIEGQICPARIVYFYEQPFGAVFDLNIYVTFLTLQICYLVDGIFKEIGDHHNEILRRHGKATACFGGNFYGDTVLACSPFIQRSYSLFYYITNTFFLQQ